MPYEFYKVLHLTGLFMVFSGLGGQFILAINSNEKSSTTRKWLGIMHGLGLLVALVAGFGLLARLGASLQGWAVVKLAIWVLIGGVGAIAARKRHLAGITWILSLLLGLSAAYLAIYKPF